MRLEQDRRQSAVQRFADAIAAVEAVAATALLATVIVAVVVQVVMRYALARPNPWTEELSRFAFIWLSLVGASLALNRHAHFSLDLVSERLPAATRRYFHGAVTLMLLAMTTLLAVLGALLMLEGRLERSPALGLPMIWVYAALPAAAVCMSVHLAAALAEVLAGERSS